MAILLTHDRNSATLTINLLELTDGGTRQPEAHQVDFLRGRIVECAAITCGDQPRRLKEEFLGEYRIWWTSQADCAELGGVLTNMRGVPAYIRREFRSRQGRNGRGRLWIHESLPAMSMTQPEQAPPNCGGVVIRAGDVDSIRGLPGFVTDLAGHRI